VTPGPARTPARGWQRQPYSLHRYTYAENNPVLYTDPSGQCATGLGIDTAACAAIIGVAIVGIFVAGALVAAIPYYDDIISSFRDVVDTCEPLLDELFRDVGKPVVVRGPAPSPKPNPTAPPIIDPVPPITETPQPKRILYHYTDASGLAGIRASETINASKDPDHAIYGPGQYFTDISPWEAATGSDRQLSRALYNVWWNYRKVQFYVAVNVIGLNVKNVGPTYSKTYGSKNIYLHVSETALSVKGRIESSGSVLFSK